MSRVTHSIVDVTVYSMIHDETVKKMFCCLDETLLTTIKHRVKDAGWRHLSLQHVPFPLQLTKSVVARRQMVIVANARLNQVKNWMNLLSSLNLLNVAGILFSLSLRFFCWVDQESHVKCKTSNVQSLRRRPLTTRLLLLPPTGCTYFVFLSSPSAILMKKLRLCAREKTIDP